MSNSEFLLRRFSKCCWLVFVVIFVLYIVSVCSGSGLEKSGTGSCRFPIDGSNFLSDDAQNFYFAPKFCHNKGFCTLNLVFLEDHFQQQYWTKVCLHAKNLGGRQLSPCYCAALNVCNNRWPAVISIYLSLMNIVILLRWLWSTVMIFGTAWDYFKIGSSNITSFDQFQFKMVAGHFGTFLKGHISATSHRIQLFTSCLVDWMVLFAVVNWWMLCNVVHKSGYGQKYFLFWHFFSSFFTCW